MPKVYRKSLADQAYELLRARIVSMALAPGERFVERRIVETTGFGAMPVREALDRLSQEGLIRTIPRHGYQVTPITAKYVEDFFIVWKPIAAMVFRLACQRASDEQLRQMADVLGAGRIPQSQDVPRKIEQMQAAFEAMLACADNEHLSTIGSRLVAVNARIFGLALQQSPDLVGDPHFSGVGAALIARDPEGVVRGVEAFVSRAAEAVLALLEVEAGAATLPATRSA